jgi:pimeloyl-ACP methyl ester carboxylesterase
VSRTLKRVLVAMAVLALSWGMSQALVRQMLYPAPPISVPSPPPPPLREHRFSVKGVGSVVGWLLAPPTPAAPHVLMLHGNGENLETMRLVGLFRDFQRLGVGVLALDYPGYGRSDGRPSEAANVDGAEVAFEWLAGLGGGGSPRVLAGWSLGAAVAAQVAARRPELADGLVLLSPWTRLTEVAAHHFPTWLVRTMVDEAYDSVAVAPTVRCPSLVMHGERDRLIPVSLGIRVAEALPDPKRWVRVTGAGHNDLLAHPQVWRELAVFLRGLAEAK